MKKITFFKWVFSLLFLTLFVACGGGGGDVSTSVTSQPQVSSDADGNLVVSGTVNLTSELANATNVSSVKLDGLNFTLPPNQNCTISSSTLPQSIDITNGSDVSFEATLLGECYGIDNLTLSATQSVLYTNGVTQNSEYTYLITFDNSEILSSYDKLTIEINSPTIVNINDNVSLTYRVVDSSTGVQLSDEDTEKVVVETSDSSKLILIDDNGNEVNSITQNNTPYKQVSFKGIGSGTANITITTTATIDGNTVIKTKVVPINIGSTQSNQYEITLSLGSSFSVDQEQFIGVNIVEQGSSTNYISDSDVSSVQISLKNNLLYFNNDINDYTYSYSASARKNIDLHTKTISGIEILNIKATIFDGEKYVTIENDFPITIIGGSPNSISIVYKSTSFESPFFYDTYIVHAVDKYGNPAREGSKIYLGAINGLTKDSSGNDLYVDKGGSISNNIDQAKFTLTNSSFDFSNVENQNSVVILSTEDKMDPSYLGGWSVDSVIDNSTLLFNKKYDGDPQSGLTFVIGDEKRFDICEQEPKLVDFDSSDDSYLLDVGGMKEVRLRYPSYMVGKDVYLFVNSYDDNRAGVAIRKKLWGNGINTTVNSSGCVDGNNCDITVSFNVSSSNDTLKNENLYMSNFTIGSSCGNPTITKSNTDCDGQIIINVNYKDECSLSWNGSLTYEH